MFRKSLLVMMVSGAMVAGVQAAEVQPNGYLFGNIGQSDAEKPRLVKDLDEDLAIIGAAPGRQTSSSFDAKDTAFKIGAGLQLNRHVGVEFQYTDLGKAEYKASISDGLDTINGKISAATKGFGANLVGSLPFDQFKLFGKVGYHKLKTKVDEKASIGGMQAKDNYSETEWVTSFGVGASYAFTREVELVAEYERYRDVADEYDVDFASIGLRYNF